MRLQYSACKRLWLKDHPEVYESWLCDLIAQDPSVLGLGSLSVKQKERIQTGTGRLDLLLQNAQKRYVVEIMLGRVDESHIFRCIEYWDLERRRSPRFDHFAVLVAEETTSRFFNVLSLLTVSVPLIVLQMSAFQVEDKITLSFNKLLDENLDTRKEKEVPDTGGRQYWEEKAMPGSLQLVDECYQLLREIDPSVSLSYRKSYIGLMQHHRPRNFVTFRMVAGGLMVQCRLPGHKRAEKGKQADFAKLQSEWRGQYLRVLLHAGEVLSSKADLRRIFLEAYEEAQCPGQSLKQMGLWGSHNDHQQEWDQTVSLTGASPGCQQTSNLVRKPWIYNQETFFGTWHDTVSLSLSS